MRSLLCCPYARSLASQRKGRSRVISSTAMRENITAAKRKEKKSSALHCFILWLLNWELRALSGTSGSKGDTSSMLSESPSYGTSMTS
ncbi:hypothetical protein EYF80_048446 [Liparis tanakae]|uniref:Uncharacterized protein n=1 Tax=Liparis tanakae TaxID=230148 RepID=A0A4Z2FJS7_9TELE|nr:hypothetical protein EYF80_048446 [Liparis tanakae]